MKANMPENYEEVCRLCLSKKGLMLPIFRNFIPKNETAFRLKIMSCASIEIFADDNLPSKVCHLCVHQVEKFYQFQAMCENSDAVLRSRLKETPPKNNKVNVEDNEAKESFFEKFKKEDSNFVPEYQQTSEKLSESGAISNPFTCSVCSLVCSTSDFLIDHLLKNHRTVESFHCKPCKSFFSNINQLKSHLSFHHSLTCDYCDHVFKYANSLDDHLKIHAKENIICKHCKQVFSSVEELKKHELSRNERTCTYCVKEFETKQNHQNHIKHCKQLYSCNFCDKTTKLKKDLIDHVNSCHDTCTLQKCVNCQKMFTKFEDLQEHKCETNPYPTFECKYCDAVFSEETSLTSHTSTEHGGDVLSCSFCMKKFSLRSSLKRHEKSHSGMKPYQCKFCPRKFKDSSACVVHMRTHTGEHPFQCQECHKDFKQLANLKMHTYRHHKKNQKPLEEKSEIPNQDFGQLYPGEIMESYSGDSLRGYQPINENISNTYNQSMNILISEQR